MQSAAASAATAAASGAAAPSAVRAREDFAAVASLPARAGVDAILAEAHAAESLASQASGKPPGADGDNDGDGATADSGNSDSCSDGDGGADSGSDVELLEEGADDGVAAGGSSDNDGEAAADPGAATTVDGLPVNTTSSILSVTSDYAMQNVLLQMGLRLVSRDGRVISRVSRYVLRCHACFHVTREAAQRLFCPRCGNQAMERVEVVVGPDGTEFYGVKKKYCLKGTRFSLPKPKSGRAGSANPILSEDMMMLKLGKKLRRKARKDDVDPFVPEYGTDSWFKNQTAIAGGKGTALMLTGWKNNPNERKYSRSNRRG